MPFAVLGRKVGDQVYNQSVLSHSDRCSLVKPDHPVTTAVNDAVEALERLPVKTQYAAASLLKRATENVALRLGVPKIELSLIDKQVEARGAELDLLMSPGALLVEA